MGKVATESTLLEIKNALSGGTPERTAKVTNVTFDSSQFESGKINNSTGQNEGGSGFYRTIGYIPVPEQVWYKQLYAPMPFTVFILYYSTDKTYQKYEQLINGSLILKDYPYCRLYFFNKTEYLSTDEFITNHLKIQYIKNAPGENEYFLHNHLFNGNFEFDRDDDGIADGWELLNSPTASAVDDNTQSVTPASQNYFLRMTVNPLPTNHVVYVSYEVFTQYSGCVLYIYSNSISATANNKFERYSQNVLATVSNVSPRFIILSDDGIGHPVYIRNVIMIDLTEIYGAGNEPTAAQVDTLINKWYSGYVPCECEIKYDDSGLPLDLMTILANMTNSNDVVTFENGNVSSVQHYENDTLINTAQVSRDMFGNIVAITED